MCVCVCVCEGKGCESLKEGVCLLGCVSYEALAKAKLTTVKPCSRD